MSRCLMASNISAPDASLPLVWSPPGRSLGRQASLACCKSLWESSVPAVGAWHASPDRADACEGRSCHRDHA